MVEPYESRRQKKPTGAVKPMPGKNPGPMRPNASVTPYLRGNTFPLPFSGSVGTPSNYYGMTGRTHPTALGIYPADVATQSAVRTLESSTRVPDKRFPGRWNVPARTGPGGAMPLSARSQPYTKATTSNPTMLPYQIQTPRPSFLRPTSPWNYVQSPVARPAPQPPPPASVPIDLTSYRPGMASAAPPQQPMQVAMTSMTPSLPQSPVQAAAPRPAVYPMYPGSSEWDTAPGWLARAGGVNTSTPEGRMFAAMNRPSVPAAIPAKPVGPSPWDIGTAAMNLGAPQLVKPYESATDRHAQAAAQQRRRPVGGQMAGELAASAGNFSTGPNLSIPGGAEAVARAEAKRQQAATLAQSFDRLRERSKAVPFGTYLAGTPETIGNLTQDRPWIDPAKTTRETMTWDEYLMKNQAQKAAMEQGRPFDLVPAWIGSSGRQTPPTTWDLAKQKSSTTGEGTVAEAIRSRAAERKLKEEPRRAMVTAKAQGRRISPVQAGVEAALTAGRGLTEDQLRAAYGPTYDQIQAQREDSSNKLLAGIAAAIGGAMQPGPNGEPAASPLTISSIFGPLLNRAMGQEGGAPTMPWPGAAPDNSPYGKVSRAFGLQPELFAQFNKALNAGDFDTARKMGRGVAQDQETVAAVEALIRAYEGSPPPLPKRPAQVSSEAMKRLEEKAAAGDPKAQQVLEEHKRTWPGGVQDKGYFIGEGGVYF